MFTTSRRPVRTILPAVAAATVLPSFRDVSVPSGRYVVRAMIADKNFGKIFKSHPEQYVLIEVCAKTGIGALTKFAKRVILLVWGVCATCAKCFSVDRRVAATIVSELISRHLGQSIRFCFVSRRSPFRDSFRSRTCRFTLSLSSLMRVAGDGWRVAGSRKCRFTLSGARSGGRSCPYEAVLAICRGPFSHAADTSVPTPSLICLNLLFGAPFRDRALLKPRRFVSKSAISMNNDIFIAVPRNGRC